MTRSPAPSRSRARAQMAAALAAAVLLAGCITGTRPHFDGDEPPAERTGDAAIDAVLARLDVVRASEFTLTYDVLTRLGGIESIATVVQSDDSRRSITISSTRFIDGGATTPATCDLNTGECEATINDARVSNLQMTHDFYGSSAARRLRVDAGRRIGDARGYHDITASGVDALCADVPVSGGTKTYCALENGALGRYDGNDLVIELTKYSDLPDETAFATN